jgi:hypothetical protein
LQVNATKTNGVTVSGGTASLGGTTNFANNAHSHTGGGLYAAIACINGDVTYRQIDVTPWQENFWTDINAPRYEWNCEYQCWCRYLWKLW